MRRWFNEILEMIRETVLLPWVAEMIFRRGMYRPGGGSVDTYGVPPGGKKGYALFKKSDADWDVEWQPSGPYIYDWAVYWPQEWSNDRNQADQKVRTDAGQQQTFRVFDAVPSVAVEPVPSVDLAFVHMNQPLRSGVDHAGEVPFVRDPWRILINGTEGAFGSQYWSNVARVNTALPLTNPQYKNDPDYSFNGDPQQMKFQWPGVTSLSNVRAGMNFAWGMRGNGSSYSATAMRIQGYFKNVSNDAWWEIFAPRWFKDASPIQKQFRYDDPGNFIEPTAHQRRIKIPPGDGYYDSGWLEFEPFGYDFWQTSTATFPVTANTTRGNITYHDFIQSSFQCIFLEVQIKTYQFSDHYDWLFARGVNPQ